MSYTGQTFNLPLGNMGLYTDDSPTITPPQGLKRAINAHVKHGFLEKEPGSRRWNQDPLPSGVVAVFDWWPGENVQHMIAVTKDGRVWRFENFRLVAEVLPTGSAPARLRVTDQVVIIAGGKEAMGKASKLFIFTGNDPVQIIEGDGVTRRNMSKPAFDWTASSYPRFGLIHSNRMWCPGGKNTGHIMYASSVTDHEDFQTTGSVALVNVFPGQGEQILDAVSFKGKLAIFKYPFGNYVIDDSQAPVFYVSKLGDSFGAASSRSCLQVMDDLWVANSSGSISSLSATLATGGFATGDVLKMLKCVRFMQEETAQLKAFNRHALWYEDKKMALFTFQSPTGLEPDRIFVVDFHSGQPRAMFTTKDKPLCLANVKDINLVNRPYYGASDGYIYEMDHGDLNVGGSAYTMEVQTEDLDFGFMDRNFSEMNKNFDFLEITFQPRGNWNVKAEIYIDQKYVETVTFNMGQGPMFDISKFDVARWGGLALRSQRKPLHGQGRRINVKLIQDGLNQGAQISALTFYFRPAGQRQRSDG